MIQRKGELELDGVIVPVDINDASTGGMRIKSASGRLPDGFVRGTRCTLRVIPERPDFYTEPMPCFIQNVSNDGKGAVYGLQFEGLKATHYRGIADAMYADMQVFENFRSSRRSIKGITMGTLQFFWWSINHTIRAFYYAIALRHNSAPKAVDGEQMAEPAIVAAPPAAAVQAAPEAVMARPMATAH